MAWTVSLFLQVFLLDSSDCKKQHRLVGIDVVSEVELAYEVSKSPIVAVTGTMVRLRQQPY